MKETETLSYSLLVQLYEQVKEMEDETMKYLMLLQVGTDELTRQMNYQNLLNRLLQKKKLMVVTVARIGIVKNGKNLVNGASVRVKIIGK